MGGPAGSQAESNHFIELLNIFHIKMPLWLAYDHWTGLHTATKIVGAPDGASVGRCIATGHASLSR